MTKRRYLTPKERAEMLLAQKCRCYVCGTPIGPQPDGTSIPHIAEHWWAVKLGNPRKPDCLLCAPCADKKTNGTKATSYGSDKHAIAKVKRLRGETKQGPKKKIYSRGFNKTMRKKFNGDVEVRG